MSTCIYIFNKVSISYCSEVKNTELLNKIKWKCMHEKHNVIELCKLVLSKQ